VEIYFGLQQIVDYEPQVLRFLKSGIASASPMKLEQMMPNRGIECDLWKGIAALLTRCNKK
jgi:hypothetical protein